MRMLSGLRVLVTEFADLVFGFADPALALFLVHVDGFAVDLGKQAGIVFKLRQAGAHTGTKGL